MVEHLVGRRNKKTISILAVPKRGYKDWIGKQAATCRNWLEATGWTADEGKVALIPDRRGNLDKAVLGLGDDPSLWTFAHAPRKLPKGRYAFDELDPALADDAALGWALAGYEFTQYKKSSRKTPTLVWPDEADKGLVGRFYQAIKLGRDLINTPAQDMGPEQLAGAAEDLAPQYDATVTVLVGEVLLEENYPAIHAVGRAASRAPRLIDLQWGDEQSPKLTLVGKGVCFDSGGLDIKTASGMKLMKKDMGGAAMALALAQTIMDSGLDVRLRVLIPAVENAVSGDAYRPGDVLQTRKGITVEVGNTDAEGRLVMSDALAEADSEKPDLLLDFATLTGAARVALGTELPALFCNDDAFAQSVLEAGVNEDDELWRMPLHNAYRRYLDSSIADINNVGSTGYGGAITAALFLREFVSDRTPWAHVDTMGWNNSSSPGRPSGGEVFGLRAFYSALLARYGES